MRRILYISVAALVSTLPLTINAVLPQRLQAASSAGTQSQADNPMHAIKDSPPDTTPYSRSLVAEDFAPGGVDTLTPDLFVRDVVVSNTNANLTNTDNSNDGEPSIAINPSNTNEIVILAFSGSWGTNAPLWHSTDGGSTWSKQFTVPAPPGVPSAINCPCDQAPDFDRSNNLSGTFLSSKPTDVYSGTTTNASNSASWNWLLASGNAVMTNSVGAGNTDQPWLLVNRDTATASQDNVYVAYDDFNGAPDMRVAVALGTNPPNFVRDNQSGTSGGSGIINPGNRLAVDPRNGTVYDLFQQGNGNGSGTVDSSGGSYNIKYFLNRSTDGGQTWGLNGMGGGVQVANADSEQGINPGATFSMGNCTSNNTYKFGTVNALLGGVDHAAVDPTNGDVYYVYGNRDSGTGNNRLSIIRLTDDGSGGLTIGASNFVTGQVQAALPSVAVTSNGVVGVLYTQFDGISGGGFPMFSAHLALSENQGATFTDFVLENFLSSAADSGACRQRVLGDYQQVKAVGNTFYGVFTGNGAPFGRPVANHDPIFFKVQAVCTITCPANVTQSNDPNQCGAVVTYPPPTAVSCGTVVCSPASGSFFPTGTTTVTCTTQQPQSCSFTVTVNDTQAPTITCPADFNAAAAASCPIATSAPVNFTVTASDNCSGVTIVCKNQDNQVVTSGQPFPVGTTTVTCTATDTSGNTATCSFTVNTFSFCLQDETSAGNVVLVNAQTGDYFFCCGGVPIASGRGTLTTRGCIGTIDHIKGNRKVHIEWDTAANNNAGAGTAYVQKSPSGSVVCQITDKNMSNNTCQCSGPPPAAAPKKPPKERTL
jgi:HYR domain